MSKEELKNKMDTFIECYKNGMIFGAPTDIEFYEKIASLQQKVEQLEKDFKETNDLALNLISKNKQLENIRKEAIEYIIKNLRQDMLSDFTGASYIQEYMIEPDDLLNILNKGDNKE